MHAMKAKVLIVDDDDFSPIYLAKFLGDRFDFDHAPNGQAALAALAKGNPDVILMDVEMPGGMNGYQTCRAIKDDKGIQHIPVFFISAHSMAEDRLKAYESGGDDYVSKPFNVEELKFKIGLALASQRKRNELAEKARQATMAMMSIREAANAGAVLGFLSDIVRLSDLELIAETTLRTLQKFRIEGAVQLREGRGHVSRNSAGACTPVEDAVLTKMASDSRIVDLGKRSAFNYQRATIIIYDMPVHDPELYGRLKDTVVKMAEALDVHMRSREMAAGALERSSALQKVLKHNAGLSRDIGARVTAQRDAHLNAMRRLAEVAERAGAADLPESQKNLLQNLARDILAQAQTAYDHSGELEKSLHALCSNLDAATPQDATITPKADTGNGAARFNSVELF
jgi:CheY-like chemotaxis protein